MANRHRGEIDARLDGTDYRLCLTLGALAELEAAFGDEDMLALAERFDKGRLGARDCMRVIGAGLRGAGYAIADDDVGRMKADGGAAEFVSIVARLLAITFGGAGVVAAEDAEAPGDTPSGEGRAKAVPFPGTT